MDEKSLAMLEFPQVREIVAGFTSFSASRELAENLAPSSDYARIDAWLRQSAEARYLLNVEQGFSIGGVYDIRNMVKMAKLGKILDPQSLLEIEQTLAAVHQMRNTMAKSAKDIPLLWNIASGITELRPLEKEINNCITPTAEVFDGASPKLTAVRRQLRETRQHLLDHLEGIMKTPRGHRIVQEPIITEREGRYVIPVKIEHQKEIKGIVHDVSNTGVTVFVEPWTTMEMGNELREMVGEERREVERILSSLSAEVGEHEAEISRNVSVVAEIDLALAKARYARRTGAVEPELVTPDSKQPLILKLVNARHPLLGGKAVPLSLEIGNDYSIMVITGPNTGGKTVTLKTIGLLSAMVQAGLPIPAAAESCVPVFDNIYADIGDEQSIEQTLSTFSWHIGNIVRFIRSATSRSLVLLDELGTSTDPAEGSALARSILLYLLSRRVMAVVTTHFGDLKAFAHTTPGLRNASLGFDPVTLTPTYQILVGIPGGSNALATASRLGLPAEIVEGARGMLSRGAQELEALLTDLAEEKTRLDAMQYTLTNDKAIVEQRKTELDSEVVRLKSDERRILEETRDGVVREAAELQKEIRQAVAELRKEKRREGIEDAKKMLSAMQARLSGGVWKPKTEAKTAEVETNRISKGDTVRLKEANLEATVLSISEASQEIEVQAGQTQLRLGLDRVEKVTSSRPALEYVPTVSLAGHAVPRELDLRGKRADEVEPLLDSYLNDAALAQMSEVRIIHGMATGVVRKIVREALAAHPLVKTFCAGERGEGGDGATVVRL